MNLFELRDALLALPALENRMSLLQGEIRCAENEAADLLARLEKESRDVESMQKDSFSAFLLKLVGKYEDKLEKEQREEICAKLEYDRASARLDSLMRDKDDLSERISDLRRGERTYQAELSKRRHELTGDKGARYAALESERGDIVAQITDIKEALRAASRAKAAAQSALEFLQKAEGWSTYDAFAGGGLITHLAKYDHLDSAERSLNVLSSQLGILNNELKDVRGLTMTGLAEISSLTRTVDFWFDNIFTDLSVRGKIKGNCAEVRRIMENISKAEVCLNSKLHEFETALEQNNRREEDLLLAD